ncbi:class I SAM-dependent methyltransferase, partial [Micromonospora andamanensis]
VARQGAVVVTDGIAALDLPHDDQPVITAATDGELEATIVESRITALIAKGIGSQPATPDDIAAALGLDDNFRDLLRLWLDWLTERAVLTARSGRYGVGERWGEVCDPRTWLATTAAADGPLHAVALRLAAVEHEIAEILRGERSPLMLLEDPVLSPEALVAMQPDTEAAIDWVARTITKLAAALGRPIRIADLGCRTGVAAQRLLARVDGDQVEATLLDTSPRLLELAAARLDHAPHAPQLRTVTDTSVPPDLRHAFDVVMMTGALHRYGDPVDGAAQAGELLAPRGVLIGLEHRELAPVALLTAAVLERGFGGSRRGPMLDAEGWTEVLAAAQLQEIGVHEQDSALLLLTARSAADRPVVREDEVLADLRRELPAHMVPERLVALSRLPLSANGKVDRARVAELLARTDDGEDASEPPRTDIERLITQLWGELLSVTVPGRLANFFALGGDSLTATQFAEALLGRYGVTLPLRQMFAEPTVAAVADAVAAQLDESTEEGVL